MSLGSQIGLYRRKMNMTQEVLAQKLGVTNQAVSKWESDQCCPDIGLLPQIADIFGVTLDALFGRKNSCKTSLPWEDDGNLHAVLYLGHQLMESHPAAGTVNIECGDINGNLSSAFSVVCNDVSGSVNAGGNVTCGDVEGPVEAGGNVTCEDVAGSVNAGASITCGDVEGDAVAGTHISCEDVGGKCAPNNNRQERQ